MNYGCSEKFQLFTISKTKPSVIAVNTAIQSVSKTKF
jgi:hypothetical protein